MSDPLKNHTGPADRWPSILSSAGELLGLDLSPDADGYLHLSVDAQTAIHLQCTDDGRQLTMFGVVANASASEVAARGIELLQAQHFWTATAGATFSWQESTGELMLARVATVEPLLREGTGVQEAIALLQGFADILQSWQRQWQAGHNGLGAEATSGLHPAKPSGLIGQMV